MAGASRFSEETRLIILTRAGFRCERCGTDRADYTGWSVHHRRPARMGGDKRPEARGAANGILLCGSGTTGCHGWVESSRAVAMELGLLLRSNQIPAEEPVTLLRGRVLLADDGTYALEGAA